MSKSHFKLSTSNMKAVGLLTPLIMFYALSYSIESSSYLIAIPSFDVMDINPFLTSLLRSLTGSVSSALLLVESPNSGSSSNLI